MKSSVLLLALLMTFSLQAQVYQLSEVDQAPVFAKGKMSKAEFLKYYLQYPQSAHDAGVEGTVVLEYTVDSTGMVLSPKVARSVSSALDEEALRLASLIPFYTPAQKAGQNVAVKLQFQVPFVLNEGQLVSTPNASTVTSTDSDAPKNPLYVVNDKVLEENANINPDDIKKIRIVKGKKAIELYGERAKDGVILIETK